MTAAEYVSAKNPVTVRNQRKINLDLNGVMVEIERLQISKIKKSFFRRSFLVKYRFTWEVNYESNKLLF